MPKKVKKVRINFRALIMFLLIIYLIGMVFYTFFTMKIKNIYILNTKLLKDNEIIEVAGIKDYPPIFKINTKKLEDKIKSLDLVSDVKVKKNLKGVLTIEIEEAKPLFYNRSNELVVLSNAKEVKASSLYLGIPTLTNYVPEDIYKAFIKALGVINTDIIEMIDKIEYNPDISDDVVIDNNRFLFKMNDGNLVYTNTLNMKRLNDYIEIYASIASSLNNQKGTLYLDSYLSDNNLFTPFEEGNKND